MERLNNSINNLQSRNHEPQESSLNGVNIWDLEKLAYYDMIDIKKGNRAENDPSIISRFYLLQDVENVVKKKAQQAAY